MRNTLLNNKINKKPVFDWRKSKRVLAVLIAMTLMALAQFSFAQKVELLEESTITNEGLYFWYPNGKKAFSYAANISPRADCFTVANGYIFFGWYKGGMANRDLMISRKKIGSGKWVHVQLPHKNTLVDERYNPTPYPNGLGNSHQTVSVGVSEKDNTIHILFDHHNDPLNYIISKKGKAFVPDNQFKENIFESRRRYLAPGENIRVTYPELNENDQGNLILNYRFGNSHAGEEVVHSYNGSWTRSKVISSGRPPKVPQNKSNYAYGNPVFGNGEFYYAFSVRWDNNRAFNEGVYLAKCGPNFTGQWEDLNGRNHQLPVTNFAPFLVDDPATENDGGSTGSVGIAVSDAGDVHLSYKGRGTNTDYYYSYVRKAGENSFTRHKGVAKTGVAWGDRIYNVNVARNGIITIESTKAGTFNYREDLRFDANKTFGNSEYRISDGKIVVIVEDRSNRNTDKNKIYSYVFNINGGGSTGNQAPTVSVTSPANNTIFEVGQEIALKASASDPDGNLDKVNFKINDDFYKTVSTRPFDYTFTPTEPGTYKIAALAIDKENKKTETFVTITVEEKNDAPIASFTAPNFSSLEEGYSELYINVDATDPDGDDISVMLKIDGQEIRSETLAPFEWGQQGTPNANETIGLAIGDHVIEAVVTDSQGRKKQLFQKPLPMSEKNEAPIASFISS